MSKKKKIILLVALGLALGLLVGIVIYFLGKNSEKTAGDNLLNLTEDRENEANDLFWEDEAGFSFYYPEGIEINDETPDNDVYYSKLILSQGGGEITLSVQDTKESKIEDYLKKNAQLGTASLYGATNLGDMSAKQYANGNSLFTLAIDQGVLFLIQGPKDGAFWEKTQALIVDTFAFKGQEKTTTSGTSNNVIYEEEEVVE